MGLFIRFNTVDPSQFFDMSGASVFMFSDFLSGSIEIYREFAIITALQ
jgi:hypothetical protein